MFLPFQKCEYCGRRIGLKEWWRMFNKARRTITEISKEKDISYEEAAREYNSYLDYHLKEHLED